MIGNILGAMECLGLIGISIHYFGVEKLSIGFLIFSWFLVLFPIIIVLILILLGNRIELSQD